MNRVSSQDFPDDVCEVVFQPKQFSWVGNKFKTDEVDAWNKAGDIADTILNNCFFRETEFCPTDPTGGALYFYNPEKVEEKPNFSFKFSIKIKIKDHDFH